jgi:hypothetical protein
MVKGEKSVISLKKKTTCDATHHCILSTDTMVDSNTLYLFVIAIDEKQSFTTDRFSCAAKN